MGNCLAHDESRRRSQTQSTPQCAMAPLSPTDEPEKELPLRPALVPCRRDKATRTTPRPKRSVRFAEDDGKKEVVRVKVVMTKKEAALLLSMLAGGSNESSLESMVCELEGDKGCGGSPTRGQDALESLPAN